MEYNTQAQQAMLSLLSAQFQKFHAELRERPVSHCDTEFASEPLPKFVVDIDGFYQKFDDEIAANLSASNGGRYWGFVTGGANPSATLADWIVTTFNQNVAKGGDSIASKIEQQTIAWLCELFYLPADFKGLFTTGATAANLLGAVTARQYVGKQQGIDIAQDGMSSLDVAIFSATPHASMVKGLGIAGFGQRNWRPVQTLPNSEAMCVLSLEKLLKERQNQGCIVIASAATVTGTDYDNLVEVSKVCKAYGAWLHVDAAFGIFERVIHGPHGKTAGIEYADSITLDCHKWLNVPYDCGVFLTNKVEYLVSSCEVDAPYLANYGLELPFMSLGIENSRRFRALPVWATLVSYGRDGITEQINQSLSRAQQLANWLTKSKHYDLVKPCILNVVLFDVSHTHPIETSKKCLEAINRSGIVFMTPGEWQGRNVIRAAFSNWQTSVDDVDLAIALLRKITT